MIGSNRAAAEMAGVNVKRNVLLGFLMMGLFYGIAGILFTSRLGASTPSDAVFLELDAIAAAVIGGVALSGGRGQVPIVFLGALLLTAIDNAMSILGASSFLQQVIKGGILLVAVTLDVKLRSTTSRR